MLSLGVAMTLVVPSAAFAQESEILKAYPTEEKAIFAFFRAANAPPDYDFWIKSSWQYTQKPENQQRRYYIDEELRLGRGFGDFDANKHVIVIFIDAMTRYHPAKDGKNARITFRLNDVRGNEIPTFDFPFGDGYVSMIIRNLKAFQDLPVSEDKAKVIEERIPYDDDEFNTTMEVHIQVKEAEYGKPLEVDGKMKWLMGGDVAYMKCVVNNFFSGTNDILWDYVAPWYEKNYLLATTPKEETYPHPYDLFKD